MQNMPHVHATCLAQQSEYNKQPLCHLIRILCKHVFSGLQWVACTQRTVQLLYMLHVYQVSKLKIM